MSSFEPPHEVVDSELERPGLADSSVAKYAFDVESHFGSKSWTERFLVEVHARNARDARYHIASNLDELEQIVSPVLRVA